MTKTQKKIDATIVKALTEVCEIALKQIEGFQWITHVIDFSNLSQAIRIICVLEFNWQCTQAEANKNRIIIEKNIEKYFQQYTSVLKNINWVMSFDSEENCDIQHAGDWIKRLK